jgi:tetratricopeptide (TPR) repeat protein
VRRIALVLAGCCLAPLLHAATVWTYAASDHFEVYTTAGRARAQESLVYFERVHAFFTDYLKLSPRQAHPTRLVIFSNDKEYTPYRSAESAVAFYQPGPDRDYIVMRSLDADAMPLVVHEYAHLVIRHSGETFPVWLNEGMAEYFSTLSPEAGKMSIGHIPASRLRYLTEGSPKLLPLDQLFAVDHNSPEYTTKEHAGLFYSESWALTHMLLSDERYRPQSSRFLATVSGGTRSAAAFEVIYGKSAAAVFSDLVSYIHQDRYRYQLVDYRMPPQNAKAPVRTVSAFDGGLVTANLLANSQAREADARAAFDALARGVGPADELALVESRAYFELRHGHTVDAQPYFARAVELGSTNAGLLRDYAVTIGPADLEKAESLLIKAVALAPEDLEARLRLADVFMRRRKTGEAVTTLSVVTTVPTESAFKFFQLLANAAAQANRLDEAKRAAARAVEFAKPGEEARQAAQLSAAIDSFAARKAASDQAVRDPGAQPPGIGRSAVSPVPGPTTGAASSPGLRVVEGRIMNIVCESTPPVMEVATGGGTVRLVIDSPQGIRIEGAGDGPANLTCGKQDKPARVGYDPFVDAAHKTIGKVRLLDFRK